MFTKRRVLIGSVVLVLLVVSVGLYFYYSNYTLIQAAPIGSGYMAQIVASGLFVSNRSLDSILTQDLNAPELGIFNVEIDKENKIVSVSVNGLFKKQSIYREGLGCTLLNEGISREELEHQTVEIPTSLPENPEDIPWPTGDRVDEREIPAGVNQLLLDKALNQVFSEPDLKNLRQTRAVVVVYDGKIVAERYAPGIHKDMPLIGWSMTKSVVNALVGILVKEGKLSLEDRAPVPEWNDPNDVRHVITINDMLQMSSGLLFEEHYSNPLANVNLMLWDCSDMGAYAASQPLYHEPGSHWQYSSGTTNIITRIIRHVIGNQKEYFAFPRNALFNKIGMRSAVIEVDAAGNFIGSSLMYATARDWARFGLLYLNDGVWEGEQILPEGWVKYTTTPVPHAPKGNYGAHFWLNAGIPNDRSVRDFPKLPIDLFWASGFQNQSVVVIPSKKLIVVRLSMTHGFGGWNLQEFILKILDALPNSASSEDSDN
jgi:CubicO group peptidase (beta-lactamase class C family)